MMNPENFRRGKPRRFPGFLFFAPVAALVFGGIVMWLWNAILPALLKVSIISYWQAVGLLVLCRILFGSFRPGGGPRFQVKRDGLPPQWKERMMNMTEAEKTAMREEWKRRCERRRH